jgi:hypothetical protein
MLVGQDGILRGGWQPPLFARPRRPIANRPQLNKLPHKATVVTKSEDMFW